MAQSNPSMSAGFLQLLKVIPKDWCYPNQNYVA